MRRFKDPRIVQLIAAIEARFPETTVITIPTPDAGIFDECTLKVLNAPEDPPLVVERFSFTIEEQLWGDDPIPVMVGSVSPENTAKHYCEHLREELAARQRRPTRRRRTSVRSPARATKPRRSKASAGARRSR